MGGPLLARLRMCRFEEGVCRFEDWTTLRCCKRDACLLSCMCVRKMRLVEQLLLRN